MTTRNRGLIGGAVVDSTDFNLPSIVTGYGNGTNAITSATFAALPSVGCSAAMTNPHPFAKLLVLVHYGAWMQGAASTDVRGALSVSGSMTIDAGIGGGPIGWGEILYTAASVYGQQKSVVTYELPASATAATFTFRALRTGAGATKCDYATIRIVPVRYLYL